MLKGPLFNQLHNILRFLIDIVRRSFNMDLSQIEAYWDQETIAPADQSPYDHHVLSGPEII